MHVNTSLIIIIILFFCIYHFSKSMNAYEYNKSITSTII